MQCENSSGNLTQKCTCSKSFQLESSFGQLTVKRRIQISVKHLKRIRELLTQPAIICSKLTIETLEQGVKYVQS